MTRATNWVATDLALRLPGMGLSGMIGESFIGQSDQRSIHRCRGTGSNLGTAVQI